MITLSCFLIRILVNPYFLAFLLLVILSILIFMIIQKRYLKQSDTANDREELLHFIDSTLEDIILVYDTIANKIEYTSSNFEKTLGISRSKLADNLYVLFDYVDVDHKKDLIKRISRHTLKAYLEIEFVYHHPISQNTLSLVAKIYPIYKDSLVKRYIICIKDITKQIQTETAIRDELSEIKNTNIPKNDLLSLMSHELKTPINAILGMTKLASKSLDHPDKTKDCLDKIDYSSRNLLIIIENYLENAKLDNEKIVLYHEPFSLSQTLMELSSLIHVQAEMKQQFYNFKYNKLQHDYLLGDCHRLAQILNNCLYNALKFTPSGGTISLEVIELKAYEEKGVFRFIISDNGKGMHEEFLDQIFNAFVQEDETIGVKYGGSGLGMYIVKNLITLMEGDIHVESQVNHGTKITIDIGFRLLPAPVKCSETDKHSDMEDTQSNVLPPVRRAHILVVEDNELNLEITCEYLKLLQLNYNFASSSEEAIRLFNASPEGYYDIILMDLQLPDADGYETTRMIRGLTRSDAAKVQIIALTADDAVKELSFQENEMNGYIMKPVDLDKLSEIINKLRTEESIHC